MLAMKWVIIFLLIVSNVYSQETNNVSWFKKTFKELTMNEVLQVSKSPKDLCFYVHSRVDYKSDINDYTKPANETWNDKTGDCEDFANCILTLCESNGYPADIKIVFENNNPKAHAVVTGVFNGKHWVSSNGNFQYIVDENEIKRLVARDMGWNKRSVNMTSIEDSLNLFLANKEK